MLKKMILPLTLAAAILGLSSAVYAEESPAEAAVEYRQGAYTITKTHFGRMGAMVKGATEFNAGEFKKDAEVVAMMSQIVGRGFELKDSITDDSEAKPNIWTDPEGFKSKLEAFQVEAANLVKAADTGDMEQIKPVFGKVAETCKACHKEYRED
ncbi:c-type cytochrome [Thiofilum flexile]|uniref:c-type cytochrome n=1 Tax=Thiofilum flexile TaxID=125627 RepID=UPI000366A91E|nr:cytochrome c [Thiofilum flexile]